MVSENDVARKEKSIQIKIDNMKTFIKEYKKGVEECIVPKISSNAMLIERWKNLLERDKEYFMTHQQRAFKDLEGQYITYFQKLINGHCECKPRAKK